MTTTAADVNRIRLDFADSFVYHTRRLKLSNWLIGATDRTALRELRRKGGRGPSELRATGSDAFTLSLHRASALSRTPTSTAGRPPRHVTSHKTQNARKCVCVSVSVRMRV